jgi:uncharacterized protein YjdB
MPSAQVIIRHPQKNFLFQQRAASAGFQVQQEIDRKTITITHSTAFDLMNFLKEFEAQSFITSSVVAPMVTQYVAHNSFDPITNTVLTPNVSATIPQGQRKWFKPTEYASIYKFPTPKTNPIVIGVISFGGGLVGQLSSGILTNGDVQAFWTSLGIPAENHPTVAMVFIDGETNTPLPISSGTSENTLDVQMIGACCPSSKLTIIIYIAPNSLNSFKSVFNYALNTPVSVNGILMKPSILSCSWGAPEVYFSNIQSYDDIFARAVIQGVNIFVATGDFGSSNNLPGANCDFPSSSPNVIACGGTSLTCPNYTYDSETIELSWKDGGGGISKYFTKPTYQQSITGDNRHTPDLALNADPATGVLFFVGGQYYVYGGTSIVAPAMAGYLGALGSSIGFINLKLYLSPSSFNDILTGSNGDYFALTGYDNTTGLGSIIGDKLGLMLTNQAPVTNITVSPSSISLVLGTRGQITGIIQPIGAINTEILWDSLNPQIATVDSTGLITAVNVGSTYITAISAGDSTKRTAALVNVTAPVIQITLNKQSMNLTVSQSAVLTMTITPATVVNKNVEWSSSDSNIASVDATGIVTGVGNGTAIISAATQQGNFVATCSVTITTPVQTLTISRNKVTLIVGKGIQLFYSFFPQSSTNPRVIWTNSNPRSVKISNSGYISGLSAGTAIITATSMENKSLNSSCQVIILEESI